LTPETLTVLPVPTFLVVERQRRHSWW